MIRFCPECGLLGDIPPGYEACCPDWSQARIVPKRFAELCAETFRLCVSQPFPQSAAAPADERAATFEEWFASLSPQRRALIGDVRDARVGWAAARAAASPAADARMLREANHALAAENDALRRALRPFAHIVSTDKLSWGMVEYCVEGDPEKQTFQAPQMQRASIVLPTCLPPPATRAGRRKRARPYSQCRRPEGALRSFAERASRAGRRTGSRARARRS